MSTDALETRLAAAWPPEAWQDVTVLVAVSGGADSVALLRGMAALKTGENTSGGLSQSGHRAEHGRYENGTVPFPKPDGAGRGEGQLLAAHVNHQLRGGESNADEAFVLALCRRLGVRCEVGRVEIPPATHGQGIEATARRARYAFLQEAAQRLGARYVVTAHTADDQAETILHRILRGTGIRGLMGMSRARPLGPATLLRPLLGVRHAELVAYLERLGQSWRHDSTNADLRFTRNRIRHRLLPQLAQQFNPAVVDALLRLGSLAAESQTAIDSAVSDLVERSVRTAGPDSLSIDCRKLARESRYLVRELLTTVWRRQGWPLAAMGFEQWELLAQMAQADCGGVSGAAWKRTFPGNITAQTTADDLRLTAEKGGQVP
jgi:tRNA(Ile)-lysidine synthase